MNQEYEILELFPTVVFKTNINSIPEKNKIIHDTEYCRYEDTKCYLSSSTNILDQYSDLKDLIYKEFNNYIEHILKMDTTNIEFYITRSWIVKHIIDDYGKSHIHQNSIFSGILYLDVDEKSGNIIFEKNNRDNIAHNFFAFDFKEWNKYNCMSWSISPKNNDLLFFPSNLHHSITRSQSNNPRYVLAFDFFIRGALSFGLRKLEIK